MARSAGRFRDPAGARVLALACLAVAGPAAIALVPSAIAAAPGGSTGDGAAAANTAAGPIVVVRGAVTDESGVAVAGLAVRVLKSRRILHLGSLSTTEQSLEEIRSRTDAQGFYEFELPADPQFPYYYLRFYDPAEFDAVKYRLPEDRDISRRVRGGRPVQVPLILAFAKDWPEVRTLVDHYGPASHCGQILRALGLPSRRTPQEGGRELWTYDKDGVAYVVEGAKVVETRQIGRPAAEAAGPSAAATPATRLDRP